MCHDKQTKREKEREGDDKERKTCTAYIDKARDEWRHLAAAAVACGAVRVFVTCLSFVTIYQCQENQKKEKKKRQSGRAREHFIKVSRDYQVDRLQLQLLPKLTNV